METRSVSIPANVTPSSTTSSMQPSNSWRQSLPQSEPEPEQQPDPHSPSPGMLYVVGQLMKRMHSEYSHALPSGSVLPGQVQAWARELTRCQVPPDCIDDLYNRAIDARLNDKQNAYLSNYMPTVHNLTAAWAPLYAAEMRSAAIEADRLKEEARANRLVGAERTETPAFDAMVEWAARVKAGQE